MGKRKNQEVLDRLERLERALRDRCDRCDRRDGQRHDGDRHDDCRHEHHRGHRDDHDGQRGGRDYDEKRIIDTIVHLVSERVGHMVREGSQRTTGGGGAGGEKRIVDLVVHLVAERVEEIVEEAFERYFAMPMDMEDDHADCGHDHEVVVESPAKRRKLVPPTGATEEE